MTPRIWYLVAAGLMMTGIAIGATGISQAYSTVEEMHRVVMPGKAELVLPAGDTTLYAERQSVVEGKAYVAAEDLAFQCGVVDQAGKALSIERSTSKVAYDMAGYQGHNVFDVHVDVPGTYVLSCEAPGPFVLAVGRGVGTWIVVAVVGGVVPGVLAVLVFVIVLLKRTRQRRRARAQAAAAAP